MSYSKKSTSIRDEIAKLDDPGSIRRECLDHVIVLGEESLRRRLRSYLRYYHGTRLHLSVDKDSPDSRPTQTIGRVVAIPQVGGLHYRYERRVA